MEKFFLRVEQNQTVLSVSKEFSVPVCKLIKDNNLTRELEVGDLLYIEKEEGELYAVRPQDTVQSICKKFNKDEDEFLTQNGVPYVFYGLTVKI